VSLWLRGTLLVASLSFALNAFPERDAKRGERLAAFDEFGQPIEFMVVEVENDPRDPTGELRLYTVEVAEDGGWHPYCDADIDGRRAAIPLAGAWDIRTGARLDAGPDSLTLACTQGAIGKCVRLGYKPWASLDGGISAADLHAACVRMIRADYCGNGRTHTLDGTRIDVFDRVGIQRRESASAGEELEAGWSPDGATWVNVPRWGDDAAVIAQECPARLANRVAHGRVLDAQEIQRRFPETILYDARMRDPAKRTVPSR
jgi:hypothetical protein